ncbi:5'-methylthioadenosine/S-adenosylhomocysteine nucleosidase family protein [Acetobacter indonesiensis]|uniref:Nucleoside phosphorylase domain-containing protein n=1 Tax=Acetobacter indonesiensis TaxID=104101 RepID=A0A252ARF4_9PROT|nr:hypothetical protein [Acetobacter indonesiensis]OUI92545.1 hypothetical protein HK17_10125 [Acetobacter indonesiensis]
MRKNLFLHFLNRDTREIVRLYDMFGDGMHAHMIRGPMNACAILCEDFCVAPPGFVVEDKYAFELFEIQSAYLEKGLVRLPMRETNLIDFAEKKRLEYSFARNRYSGLYDDTRMNLLNSHGAALIPRKIQIGPAIVDGFMKGVDTRLQAWAGIRQKAASGVIENMRAIPARLADDGKALTWSIIEPNLVESPSPLRQQMRDALQYTYFQEYCREFRAIVLADIPHIPVEFCLPVERTVYSMRRLRVFLASMNADRLLLEASADTIMSFRRCAGFIELIDAYCAFAKMFPKDTDLQFHLSKAIERTPYEWSRIPERFNPAICDPSDFEVVEIASACGELAAILTMEHKLPRRGSDEPRKMQKATTVSKGRQLKIAIFVALEEELNVLIKHFSLTRAAGSPAAIGKINDVEVDVLCPRAMGRVAAAVETMRYLSKYRTPDLLFCVGLAGGFTESTIEPGAVICVETVVDLANRKVTDDESGVAQSKFRRRDFDCARAVYEIAQSHEFDLSTWASYSAAEFDWPRGRTPSLWEGKIASADEVVASDDHRQKMVASVDKLYGIEMEAGGVCAAAAAFKVPVSVLRVVSDMADPSKADDKWRVTGMKTLAELLKRLPLDRVIALVKQ